MHKQNGNFPDGPGGVKYLLASIITDLGLLDKDTVVFLIILIRSMALVGFTLDKFVHLTELP